MTAVAEQKRLLRVVELVGPAGVGKSTVSHALIRRCGTAPRTIWGQPPLALLGTGIRLGPVLLRFWRSSGSLLWDEARHVVRLRALHLSLTQDPPRIQAVTLFDEGPIFALTWLRGFGHESMRSPAADRWWQATLFHWSRLVDAVVVLDAPDSILAARIKARPQWHEVKHEPDWYIAEWMGRFRAALEWVLAGLAAHGGPTVIRIRADQDCPERLAERVSRVLERAHGN
jgi:hypothetical protein